MASLPDSLKTELRRIYEAANLHFFHWGLDKWDLEDEELQHIILHAGKPGDENFPLVNYICAKPLSDVTAEVYSALEQTGRSNDYDPRLAEFYAALGVLNRAMGMFRSCYCDQDIELNDEERFKIWDDILTNFSKIQKLGKAILLKDMEA
ncbi:MAG: hypothetical protein D6E12_12910 [Desulfovibrio sp.]|nr:MAG: hypothetical protein D6E12_12910 [Desulfovibrio sp.]